MQARSPARYLAPIALIVTIAGAYLIVNASTGRRGSAAQHPTSTRSVKAPSAASGRRYYVVRSGDNLSRISTKTTVSLATLEQLNPSLDPNSLQPGQRLRLRP